MARPQRPQLQVPLAVYIWPLIQKFCGGWWKIRLCHASYLRLLEGTHSYLLPLQPSCSQWYISMFELNHEKIPEKRSPTWIYLDCRCADWSQSQFCCPQSSNPDAKLSGHWCDRWCLGWLRTDLWDYWWMMFLLQCWWSMVINGDQWWWMMNDEWWMMNDECWWWWWYSVMSLEGPLTSIPRSFSGIGQFTAEQLARKNHVVLVHGRNPQRVERTVGRLQKLSGAEVHGRLTAANHMATYFPNA